MKVRALKPFPYSADGIRIRQIAEGEEFDCDPGSVPGLKAEGYVAEAKAMGPSPENKMIPAAEENKAPADADPAPEPETKPARRRGRSRK